MSPLFLAGAAGVAAYFLLSNKSSAPTPIGPPTTVKGQSGKTWISVPMNRYGDSVSIDIRAPAGSFGPHAETRVLRFNQKGDDMANRTFIDAPPGLPGIMTKTAAADFGVPLPADVAARP